MEYQYKLRPHHGLCISFFSMKKYSEKYKEHIKKIIAELEYASIVCVTLPSDIFCERCPSRLQDGSCSVADKVREYDQKMQDRVWNRARISSTDLWRKRVKFVANTGYCRGAYKYR